MLAASHCIANAAGAGDPWSTEVSKPEPKPRVRDGGAASSPAPQQGPGTLNLTGDKSATLARVELDGDPAVQVFTLPNPYRVIVELTGTTLKSPSKPASNGFGLVERYHSGRFEQGKFRIVMETLGPVKATLFPTAPTKSGTKLVEIALTPMPITEFGAGTGGAPPKPPARPENPAGITAGGVPPDFGADLPGMAPAKPPERPIIIIDPGHGGIDPGAIGAEGLLEKNVVMAVAEELRQVLQGRDRYQIRLTRSADVFVSLDQRVHFSRSNAASLFISLHADAIEQTSMAQTVSGATVYTLSERASDEQARIMAEKENASDLLAGLSGESKEGDEVKNILIDLLKRETATFSAQFANVLRNNLQKSIQMSRDPMRSAAFKVLKQTHAPSVLVELGYVSNTADAKRLNSREWQKTVAAAIATAVDGYFSNRSARAQ